MTHTFEELEQLCKKRRLKKYAVIGGVAFGGLIMVGGIAYGVMKVFSIEFGGFHEEKKEEVKQQQKIEVHPKVEHKIEHKEDVKVIGEKVEQKKSNEIYKNTTLPKEGEMPSLDELSHKKEVQEIKTKPMPVESKPEEMEVEESRVPAQEPVRILKPILDFNIYSSTYKPTYEKPVPKPKPQVYSEPIHKKEVVKKETTPQPVLQTTELPPYDVCITLAKKYYANRDYKKALEWAKKANLQNKEAPESWIITAKVLYKTGQKDRAIRILQIYNDYNPTPQVSALLEKYRGE